MAARWLGRGGQPRAVAAAQADTPTPAPLAPLDRGVWVAGGILFAVLMALSPWYGFHRDELYFLDCARHLQGGYMDQPVLTPLLARVCRCHCLASGCRACACGRH